ncbi:glycosyltransferase family 4 protein [Blautia massiliensis (ex Durand et al. 2017)]|uniref:glycosyltransferase family 4 protein n=1 Tax=Blautia massiliensis (ex Durand et al. 2017) TaxID=1737424 RepID=UPI00241F8A75|nr:glycosyltransferase [Blautia massiliensis (ex Durand et al. 2017)]MBN2957183.1 glycosyltransferase family 4 protein [Blautia massiliensis (ex Durand et al. 2017)]
MKVLWITNVELPDAANSRGNNVVVGGWMHQTLNYIKNSIELYVAACVSEKYDWIEINSVNYCGFTPEMDEVDFERIIESIDPDCIHIWGSEYNHSYYVTKAARNLSKIECTVLSIQGLVSVYAEHYYDGLPPELIHRRTLKEFFGRRNIAQEKKMMELQGQTEISTFQMLENCIGRTDWDYACAKQMNPHIEYHFCGEILRESFYVNRWKYEECDKEVIFFSQAHYPIKGLHIMLRALPIIKEYYPAVVLRIVGNNPQKKAIFKRSSYEKYICNLIRDNDLSNSIEWLGQLSENEMMLNYKKANVFVCSSSIENSSNSIGEAMLVGTPIVASDVGGIKSFMEHEKEGMLYHSTAIYMLADNVIRIFNSRSLAMQLGNNAHERAKKYHCIEDNLQRLIKIYNKLKCK